jgi:predicted MFS family arabinose efflux permease
MNQGIQLESTASVASEKMSGYLWLAFFICFFSNVLGGTVSTVMSVYLPTVVNDLLGAVDAQKLNEVSAIINAMYIVGWALGGFAWGMISDRIGRARSLTLSLATYGVFTILTSLMTSWEMVVVFRMLAGFGVGGVMVISVTLLSEIFPERTRSIFIGILSIGFPVGIFSSGLVNYFIADWRQGMLVGILPIVLSVLCLSLLRESEKWRAGNRSKSKDRVTLFSPEVESNLIKGSLIFGSMLIGLWAIFSWVPTWIQSLLVNSDGQQERGMSMMILGAGGLSGGFFSGWISNSLGVRRSMLICFAGCLVLSFFLFKLNTTFSSIIYVEIAALSLLFGLSQGLLSMYVPLLFPIALRATATGICFNVGRLFTAAAVFFVGALVTTLGGYGNAIFIFSLIFIVGIIMIWITREKSPKS